MNPASAPEGCALAAALAQELRQPVLACDSAGRVLIANASARTAWPALENGQQLTGAVRFADERGQELTAERHPLARVLAGEQRVITRAYALAPDEQWALMDAHAWVLHDSAGARIGAALALYPVSESAEDGARAASAAGDIEVLAQVSLALSELQDPKEAATVICTVTAGSTGASAVMLWRSDEHGELTVAEQLDALPSGCLADIEAQIRDGASAAVREARTQLVHLPAQALGCDDVPTVWHEPMLSAGGANGALSVLWSGLLADPERPRALLGLLAAQAALALERAALLERLERAALRNPLTGLPNRREWDRNLARELQRARREHTPLSMLLLDVDRFKRYNDSFGHPAGDELLHDSALSWSCCLRTGSSDLLARLGGEEFAALLPNCDIAQACAVAQRLRTAMPGEQTCSIGAVCWDGAASAEDYAAADGALYEAKNSGRDRVLVGTLATR